MATEVPENQNFVDFHANLFKSYMRRNREDLVRQARNWGIYSGVNGKQWDPDAFQQLLDEGRAPHQVNFSQKTVDTLAGNFYQNDFELDYEANTGAGNDASLLLKDLYLTDKNRGGWAKARRFLVRAGLIFRGTVEMYKDYKTDALGSASLRYVNHNRILFDPDWTSDNMNDNNHIIQYAWMNPEEIKLVYNKKSDELENAIKLWKIAVSSRLEEFIDNRNEELSNVFIDAPEFLDILNHRFLVIQVMRLERGNKEQLLDLETGETLPQMDADNTQMMQSLRGKSLKVLRSRFARLKVSTVVPGLSRNLKLQEDEDHPVQIGRYPYFNWSSKNINGEVQGVIDVVADVQQVYNKRESTFTHWQTTSANGAELVEEDFFANDSELERYAQTKNSPGQPPYKVGSGKLSASRPGIMLRPRGEIPNDLHTSADRAFGMIPEITPVTPPLSGGEGKSGESAKLFEAKRGQALVGLEPMSRSLQDLEREIGEAYFYFAKSLYSGAQRKVRSFTTKEGIELNVPLQNGQVLNDVARIPRQTVIIRASKNGESVRRELLNRNLEILQIVQNPIYKSQLEKILIGLVPNIPEDEIAAGEKAADKFIELQESRINLELANNEATIRQLSAPPAPPGGGAPGGGGPGGPTQESLSVEGAGITPGEGLPADLNNINQLG